jgi:SOS-response transcriptional repressor LexA
MTTATYLRSRRKKRTGRKPGLPSTVTGLPTDREMELLRVLAHQIDKTGTQPSMRQVAKIMGYASIGFIHVMVQNLKRKGIVYQSPKHSKSVEFEWRNYL